MRTMLADDLVGYVTNGEAGVDRVDGADDYLSRLTELSTADATATVTQSVQVSMVDALPAYSDEFWS